MKQEKSLREHNPFWLPNTPNGAGLTLDAGWGHAKVQV